MICFTAHIKKFGSQGEKTGWTYVEVPEELAQQLRPDNRKSFRVQAMLDGYLFGGLALLPMGRGDFILVLNGGMRKRIRKGPGAELQVQLELDHQKIEPPAELLECLKDEPQALATFNKLPPSHKNYYTRWINSAKGEATKAKRIAAAIQVLQKGQSFGEAVRAVRNGPEIR